jgi:hypothetical protein
MNSWSRPQLGTDSSELFSSIEEGLTVRLIATFKPKVCGIGDDLQAVIDRQDLQQFDYVPVKDGDRTAGLLHRSARRNTESRLVGEAMDPLHEGILISSDSGILSFIERAGAHPCQLVLHDDRLGGLVTLSDLQKLPVRPALFLLVTHVELLMVEWIRARGSSEEKLMSLLPNKRRDKVDREWNRLRKHNLAVDRLTATQFCDKRDLLLKLNFVSGNNQKAEAKKDLENVEQLLRNPLAHAGDFALNEEKALEVVSTVRTARHWIGRLESAIGKTGTTSATSREAAWT